jgi:ribosomal protein L44E
VAAGGGSGRWACDRRRRTCENPLGLAGRFRLPRRAGKRRYDRKQSGYGGQTKPVFHKKVRQREAAAGGAARAAISWARVGVASGADSAATSPRCVLRPQAKTTKKIVLRMQCIECKTTCMKGLKVRAAAWADASVLACQGAPMPGPPHPWDGHGWANFSMGWARNTLARD